MDNDNVKWNHEIEQMHQAIKTVAASYATMYNELIARKLPIEVATRITCAHIKAQSLNRGEDD